MNIIKYITFKDVISVGLLYLEQFEFKLLSPDLKNITYIYCIKI